MTVVERTVELRVCPFCGSGRTVVETSRGWRLPRVRYVKCLGCGARCKSIERRREMERVYLESWSR